MNLKNSIYLSFLFFFSVFSSFSISQTLNAVGTTEISIKANGDLVNARRLARASSERDAILSALRLRMSVDANNPAIQTALIDLAKQSSDNLKTTFITEGDILSAKTTLSIDGGQFYDLARSIKGLVSASSMASSKIVFLIDEYYGVATNLDPKQPLESEIIYSHDKSKSSSSAASSSFAASSKDSAAVSSREKSSIAASESVNISARDRASVAGSERVGVSVSDSSGSGAASRNTNIAASRDSSLDAQRRSAVAASSDRSFAGASSSERAVASASSSASASSQKDIVNYSIKTKFPDTSNAKPSDGASALITARLEQIIKPFGLVYTPERDMRIDKGGKKLLLSDIEKQRKYDEFTSKAAKQPYSAKYVVFGTSVMSAEGKTPSGDVTCSGMLKLQSFSVDSGESLVSGTLNKRAQGSSDQDCRSNLATALATELASTIGNSAAREIQLAASQGTSFYVTLFSSKRIAPNIRREFTKKLELMGDTKEENASDNSRAWVIQAAGNFRTKIEDLKDDLASDFPEAKNAKMIAKGNRVVVCLEGQCPKDF
jgi:hypothetical protein